MGPLNQNPRLQSAPCISPFQALHVPCCLLRGEGSNIKQDTTPLNYEWFLGAGPGHGVPQATV